MTAWTETLAMAAMYKSWVELCPFLKTDNSPERTSKSLRPWYPTEKYYPITVSRIFTVTNPLILLPQQYANRLSSNSKSTLLRRICLSNPASVRSLADGTSEPAFANIRYIHGPYEPPAVSGSSGSTPKFCKNELGHEQKKLS